MNYSQTSKCTGTMGELIVAADLIARGYEVFKNVAVHGKVDLIAWKAGRCLTIQVKCQRRAVTIKTAAEVVAIVLPSHRVIYTPEVDPRHRCLATWDGSEHTYEAEQDWAAYVKDDWDAPKARRPFAFSANGLRPSSDEVGRGLGEVEGGAK